MEGAGVVPDFPCFLNTLYSKVNTRMWAGVAFPAKNLLILILTSFISMNYETRSFLDSMEILLL